MVKRRTIMVTPETHSALESKGTFGETFDDVISRLISESNELTKWINAYNELRSQVVGLSICYECDEKWFVDSPSSAMDSETAHCENCGASGSKSIKVFGQ